MGWPQGRQGLWFGLRSEHIWERPAICTEGPPVAPPRAGQLGEWAPEASQVARMLGPDEDVCPRWCRGRNSISQVPHARGRLSWHRGARIAGGWEPGLGGVALEGVPSPWRRVTDGGTWDISGCQRGPWPFGLRSTRPGCFRCPSSPWAGPGLALLCPRSVPRGLSFCVACSLPRYQVPLGSTSFISSQVTAALSKLPGICIALGPLLGVGGPQMEGDRGACS